MRAGAYSQVGCANLRAVGSSERFTDWLYGEICPYLQGSVLEIGSGHGTYSSRVIRDVMGRQVILSDVDQEFIAELKNTHPQPHVAVRNIDIRKQDDFLQIEEQVDSAFALNVLEHVEPDLLALRNIYRCLKPGGRLVLLVPAHQRLYNCIDKGVGHQRRYAKEEFIEKAALAGFSIKEIRYFNFFLLFGWFWNGTVRQECMIQEGTMQQVDRWVPVLRFFDRHIIRGKMGASLLAVLEK